MSVTRTQTTEMNDQSCLADALKAMGYKPTILKTAETIRGHYSEKSREKCDIVLRKEDHSRQADIGFSKGTDGKYTLVTDTYVNRDLDGKKMGEFVGKLTQTYSVAKARKVAKQAGCTFVRQVVVPNGGIKLVFVK